MKTTDDQNELFIVVDKDDNILGYKTRRECHSNKSLIHRSIGVAVFNSKGQILLQKRSETKDTHPGKWSISAGGHVTKGQSYEQAALREMKEELGVASPVTFIIKFHHVEKGEQEMDVLYRTSNEGPFSINREEVDEVKFISPNKLKLMTNELTPCAIDNLRHLKLL